MSGGRGPWKPAGPEEHGGERLLDVATKKVVTEEEKYRSWTWRDHWEDGLTSHAPMRVRGSL